MRRSIALCLACAFHIAGVAAFVAAISHATTALAAPPKLDWLLPAGAGRNSTATINVSDSAAWPAQIWLDRAEGIRAEASKEKGKLTVTLAPDAAPGIRWLRLYNDEGASALRPFIVGTLPEVDEKEPNNDSPQELPGSAVVNGRLEKNGDIDGFRIRLKRGQTLVASVTAHRVLASPMDAVVQVCDAEGFVLLQNDDGCGLDPQAVFAVPRDGDYLVRVFAFPATPDSSIHFAGKIDFIYRLTVTTGGFLDHTLPLTAAEGKPAELAVHGWNVPTEAAKVLVELDPHQGVARVGHALLAGALELPTTASPIALANDAALSQGQQVKPPVAITGRLEQPRTAHQFRFMARKSEAIRLRVESQALGFPLDPVLRISDAAGKQLSEADDGKGDQRDPSLDFKPPADAQYVASLRDLHGRGGFRFVYRLSIEPLAPDFAVTLEKDAFTASPGKPAEIPVTIDRRDGFDGDITIKLSGLPGGFTAPAAISKGKDATAKAVKVMVTASTGPWSGAFRVEAEGANRRRVATFAVTGGQRHHAAWLTVGKTDGLRVP